MFALYRYFVIPMSISDSGCDEVRPGNIRSPSSSSFITFDFLGEPPFQDGGMVNVKCENTKNEAKYIH